MRELNADRGLLALHEGDQGLVALHLRIVPDAEVVLIDQADLFDRGRFDKDQSKASQGKAAEMHVVKSAAGATGPGPVMHHRGYHHAIPEGQAANFNGLKQQGSCSLNAIHGMGLWGEVSLNAYSIE